MKRGTVSKYKFKSLPWLTKRARKVFNEYIRERDKINNDFFRCISCGKIKRIEGSKYHAGHFYPVGQYKALRFDENNVNGECVACNHYSGDHLIGYEKNLIAKIGQKEVDKLHMKAALSKRTFAKWDRLSLIDIIEKYSK